MGTCPHRSIGRLWGFVDDLRAAVDQEDHDRIVGQVGTYFSASTPRPAERVAAAVLSLERAGLGGPDLAAAQAALESTGQ